MASTRDREAAALHRDGMSYSGIAVELGFPDARAAHRGVARALAEPAAEEAALRGLSLAEQDEALGDLTTGLWALLDELDPVSPEWGRVFDTLLAVTDRRCRLAGLYTRPWRCDDWRRQDVPIEAYLPAQTEARRLERLTRIPERTRPRRPTRAAEVLHMRRSPVAADPDLVPASVRALLAERHAA